MPQSAATVRLPFDVASVTEARACVTDRLLGEGATPQAVDDVNLVAGELVMNAVRHGRPCADGMIEVSWWLHAGMLRFSVTDGGHVDRLEARMPAPTEVGGRGLAIVERIGQAWGYDSNNGTRVVVDIPLPAQPAD